MVGAGSPLGSGFSVDNPMNPLIESNMGVMSDDLTPKNVILPKQMQKTVDESVAYTTTAIGPYSLIVELEAALIVVFRVGNGPSRIS